MVLNKRASSDGPRIVVIGAGIAGMSFAIALKRTLGYDNYTIYEKASDVGGTWRDNVYPGCSSDVSSHYYSLSTDLNPDWIHSHGLQPEHQQYWQGLARKHDLAPHIVFDCTVISAEWDDAEQLYYIITEKNGSGIQSTTTAEILISALGILEVVKFPDIPGISTFEGEKFHSGRWDSSVDLRGKRVGVIGSGGSATQLVSAISEEPSTEIIEFCRTPNWFIPVNRTTYGALSKWMFRHVPLVMRVHRLHLFLKAELVYWLIFGSRFLHPLLTKSAKQHITSTAPAKYHEALIPNYTYGCKRIIYDYGYLTSLHRPNVSLNWDGINHVVRDGLVTKKGDKISLDVLICATGFAADSFPLHVRGKSRTVKEYYDTQAGPKAYMGTTIPGFPNLYILGGPNTATGHTSVIFFQETQIQYALRLIKPVLEGKVLSFEVTAAAADAYNDKIHARLARSVWISCSSWYRKDGDGKIWSLFPGGAILFWWWLRSTNWDHYVAFPPEHWDNERHWQKMRKVAVSGVLGGVALNLPVVRSLFI